MAVTRSTYISKKLFFLLFGFIYAAAIENAKNNSQSPFLKLTSVIIISSNHTLNSIGVRPLLLFQPTTVYGTASSIEIFTIVKFILPVVSHMSWRFSSWLKCFCISIGLLRNLIYSHAHSLSRDIFNIHGLPSNGWFPTKAITLPEKF